MHPSYEHLNVATSEKSLIKRIEKIEEGNAKVSLDKSWEGSWTRKIALTGKIELNQFIKFEFIC